MRAVILFSGGLDSTVILAKALANGRECLAISFDYNQRHRIELESAKKIAHHYKVTHLIIKIDPASFSQSALVSNEAIAQNRTSQAIASEGIPNTYVPARNTLFLAYAAVQAEIWQAQEIYFGPNAMDHNPYPDCRPQFINAFQEVLNTATKQAIDGKAPRIIAPLINMNKTEIIRLGKQLHAPLEMTHSCYNPSALGIPCQICDACVVRAEGFAYTEVNGP